MELSKTVAQAFYSRFSALRPAQLAAVTPILRGDDVLVLAGTGSGKTEAVVAPLVDAYRGRTNAVLLYVTPTRALANDLLRRLEAPMERVGMRLGVRHGERNDLLRKERPSFLITTPESFDVMLMSRESMMGQVQAVVIDEIHLLYNSQRGAQLAILLSRLEMQIGRSVQVVGISATVAEPSDIWAFLRPGQDVTTVRDEEAKPIDYTAVLVREETDLLRLMNVVGRSASRKVLMFTNSRRESDQVGSAIAGRSVFGDRVFTHHSSLDRTVRLDTERRFLEADSAVCVATSTLELGIDIGDIDVVMLYGNPGGWQAFLQRAGRGNRRRGTTNVAAIILPAHGPLLFTHLAFEALLTQVRSGALEREAPLEIFGAAVQQILSMVLASPDGYVRVRDLVGPLVRWPHLSEDRVRVIIDHLVETGHLRHHGFLDRVGADEWLHRLKDLRMLWGNYPARSRDVIVKVHGRRIGAVPVMNLLRVHPGSLIRFAGRSWVVREAGLPGIEVVATSRRGGLDLTYAGPAGDMDPTLVETVRHLIIEDAPLTGLRQDRAAELRTEARQARPYLDDTLLPVVRAAGSRYTHFTFAGRLINAVIARWAGEEDAEVGEVVLRTSAPLDLAQLPVDPHELEPVAAEVLASPQRLTVFQQLLPEPLLRRELVGQWSRTAVYSRSLRRLAAARVQSVDSPSLGGLDF